MQNDERPKIILEQLQQENNDRKRSEENKNKLQKKNRSQLMDYRTPLVKAIILTGITLFIYNFIFVILST